MVAVKRVHSSGGGSLWWSSVLSSHIAGCRCPGGREAHIRRCAGPSELFYAGLSGWERCSSLTRQWCSQSVCSPQCNCRTENETSGNFFIIINTCTNWPRIKQIVMSLWQFFVENTSFLYLTNSRLMQKCYEVLVISLWESVTWLSKTNTVFAISTKN